MNSSSRDPTVERKAYGGSHSTLAISKPKARKVDHANCYHAYVCLVKLHTKKHCYKFLIFSSHVLHVFYFFLFFKTSILSILL